MQRVRTVRRPILIATLLITWAVAVAAGVGSLWKYETQAGPAVVTHAHWPAGAVVGLDSSRANLLLWLHPHCPCSRATLGELARVMTRCEGKIAATVFVLQPPNKPQGWERTDLWFTAARIPGVTVVADADGAEARRFGASTSGHAMLYSAQGRLLFCGGITAGRGHGGDNAGASAITALVRNHKPHQTSEQPARTAVFGCPLQDSTCTSEVSCPQ